jgi:hypothetical protein
MLTEGRSAAIQYSEDEVEYYASLEHEDYLASLEPIDYRDYTAFHKDTDTQDASKTRETRVRTAKAVGATGRTARRLTFPDESSTTTPKGGSTRTGRGRQGGGRAAWR